MYALKTIFDNTKERVNYLGNDYDLFFKTDNSDNEFNFYFNELFPIPEINETENVYAIIYNDNILIPLYKHFTYYIVTESGKTFKKLSPFSIPK